MTDSEFLHWVASRFVAVHGEHPNVDFVLRLRNMADDAQEREETEAKYPQKTPESLVRQSLPTPFPLSEKMDLHEKFPQFSALLDEGYGLAEFMAMTDLALHECYTLFIETAKGRRYVEEIRTTPWWDVLDRLRADERRKIRRALARTIEKQFPQHAAAIALDMGLAMGDSDDDE